MIPFSPGLLQGCFELLELVDKRGLQVEHVCSSFRKFASVSSESVLKATQSLKWLIADSDGFAVPTARGSVIISESTYEIRLRKALLDFVENEKPAWLQNAIYGRDRVLSFVSLDVGQVFVEAGLSNSTEREVVEFWDDLGARARGLRNEALTSLGRQGERLSLNYEKLRTGRLPKWISIEDNADGYDILSIVSSTDSRLLPIEVKTSSQGLDGYFYLSRNEWDRSLESDVHTFHLWDVKASKHPSLAVLTVDEVRRHIPRDLGSGTWQSVKVPFRPFRVNFTSFEQP